MPTTVHQLASSLQSTSEKVIAAAKKLKIGGLSAFTELTDEEVKKIKQSFTKGSAGLLKKKEVPVKEKAEASASAKTTTSRLKKKTAVEEESEAKEEESTEGKKPAKKALKKKTAAEALEAAEEATPTLKKKTTKKALAEEAPAEEAAQSKAEEAPKKTTKKKTTKKEAADALSEQAAEQTETQPAAKTAEPVLVVKESKKAVDRVEAQPAPEAPKKEEEKSGFVRVEFGAGGAGRFPKIHGEGSEKIVKFTPGSKPGDKPGALKTADAAKEPKGIQFLFKSDRTSPAKNWIQPKFENDFGAAKAGWKEKSVKRLDSDEETEFVPPSKYLGIKSLKKHTKKAAVVAMPQRRKDLILRKDSITVGELSELSGIKAGDLIKALMKIDLMVTMNQAIPAETAQLVCMEFSVDLKVEKEDLEKLLEQVEDPKNLVLRAPVVTIMGHVDHGKTSLLDYIRKSKVAAKEAGGITQHIGAYRVANQGVGITFLDTPGHEAFTAMRARGANATDIVVLVVAADDGPKPQTVEAINHAKAAGATIIVAINKCDKPGANPEKTMQLLMEHGLQADAYGGDVSMVPVSAKTGQGIDELLQIITIQAELMDLKADPGLKAEGLVIESRVDKVRGVVTSLLVQKGSLKVGDIILVGHFYSRVRAMFNEFGEKVDQVLPSYPVEILGFNDLPLVGSRFHVVENEKIAKSISDERANIAKNDAMLKASSVNFESLFHDAKEENKKVNLTLILKADVQGSLEAIAASLNRWNNDQIELKIIHQSVGGINSSDVSLAAASKAIIVGFNVRADANANAIYEQMGVEIKLYNIIYDLLDDIKRALEGLFDAVVTEEFLGKAEVLNLFTIPKIGMVAGCKVTEGKVLKTALVRVLRDNIVIHKGKIASLKRFKDDAKEVFSGFECGLVIDNYKNLKEGDMLEFFSEKKESVVLESV